MPSVDVSDDNRAGDLLDLRRQWYVPERVRFGVMTGTGAMVESTHEAINTGDFVDVLVTFSVHNMKKKDNTSQQTVTMSFKQVVKLCSMHDLAQVGL